MFGKEDFVIIPKSLYRYLPKFVKSKNPKKVDAVFDRAAKALKTKSVKDVSVLA